MSPPLSAAQRHYAPRLTSRDYEILRGLFECRTMTLSHATALYFEGRYEAARKRVQSLREAGLVGDKRKQAGEESVLFLTTRAFDLLAAEGQLHDFPALTPRQFAKRSGVRQSTLKHELEVMDVKVAMVGALSTSTRYRIEEFVTWALLSQFDAIHPEQRQRMLVRPDGFLRVAEVDPSAAEGAGIEHNFFLELDRSNEGQSILADKALCYRDYYARGGFAVRCGGAAADFRSYPFRVLIVLKTAERRNNTAETLMNCTPPVKFQAWLTTLEELTTDPLGHIWISPLDYANATEGTVYAPGQRRTGGYVRRPERERLVADRIAKRTLFEDITP